jgi:hypothetical protein
MHSKLVTFTFAFNLNLIERFWKLLRKKVLNNRYHETFADHSKAFDNFIRLETLPDEGPQWGLPPSSIQHSKNPL